MSARVRRLAAFAALCAAAAAAGTPAGAMPVLLRFDSPGSEAILGATASADGRVLYTGRESAWTATTGAWLVAVATDDTIAWQYALEATSGYPAPKAAAHPSGGFAVLHENVVLRVQADGSMSWSVRVEGAAARDVAAASDGALWIAGSIGDGGTAPDGTPRARPWIARLDASGSLARQLAFASDSGGGTITSIAPGLDGGVLVAVTSRDDQLYASTRIIGLAADLAPRWEASAWGPGAGGAWTRLRTVPDGTCLAVQEAHGRLASWWGRCVRLDPDGRMNGSLEFATYSWPESIADAWPLADGGAMLVPDGSSCSGPFTSALARFDAQGSAIWSVSGGAAKAAPLPAGGAVLVGWGDERSVLRLEEAGGTHPLTCVSASPCSTALGMIPQDVAPTAAFVTPLPLAASVVPVTLALVTTNATLADLCAPPPPEPSALDLDPTAPPLRVARAPLGALALSWEDTGSSAYDLYRGPIAAFATGSCDHRSVACGLAQPSATIEDAAGAWYFLARSREGPLASALGRDAFGVERPDGSPRCP